MELFNTKCEFITVHQFIENFKKIHNEELGRRVIYDLYQSKYIDIYAYFSYKKDLLSASKQNKKIDKNAFILEIDDLEIDSINTFFKSNNRKNIHNKTQKDHKVDLTMESIHDESCNINMLITPDKIYHEVISDDNSIQHEVEYINRIVELDLDGFFKINRIKEEDASGFSGVIKKQIIDHNRIILNLHNFYGSDHPITIYKNINFIPTLENMTALNFENEIYIRSSDIESVFLEIDKFKPLTTEIALYNSICEENIILKSEIEDLKKLLKIERDKNGRLERKKGRDPRGDLVENLQGTIVGLLLYIGKLTTFDGALRPLQGVKTKRGIADKIIYHLENEQSEFSAKSNKFYTDIITKVINYIKH